jgi:3-oxoacyl-[acyl-carrier protein] reductase
MRRILITGGARGIGRSIAEEFAPNHATAITYHSTAPDTLLVAHPEIIAIQADLSDPEIAQTIIKDAITRLGGLDIIVNNAGAMETDATDSGQNHAVNVAAPMALLNAALPQLKAGASVINISSVNADFPAMGAASYSASKAALNTWTRAMAKTLGPRGIRVNGVAPGAIERVEAPREPDLVAAFVELTALGRIGVPSDIAKVVRFLASDAASFITGETITVSGGYRL